MRRPHIAEALAGRQVRFDQSFSVPRPATVSCKSPLRRNAMSAETVTGFIAAIVDITERKRAEQARATLAAIVESSEDAIVSKRSPRDHHQLESGAERLYGYSQQEAVGRPVTMLVPEDLLDHEVPILERIARGEAVQQYETERRRKGRDTHPYFPTVSAIRNDEGQIVGCRKSPTILRSGSRLEAALREVKHACACLSSMRPRPSRCLDRQLCYVAVSRRWSSEYSLEGDVVGRSHCMTSFLMFPERWRVAYRQGLAGSGHAC